MPESELPPMDLNNPDEFIEALRKQIADIDAQRAVTDQKTGPLTPPPD